MQTVFADEGFAEAQFQQNRRIANQYLVRNSGFDGHYCFYFLLTGVDGDPNRNDSMGEGVSLKCELTACHNTKLLTKTTCELINILLLPLSQ